MQKIEMYIELKKDGSKQNWIDKLGQTLVQSLLKKLVELTNAKIITRKIQKLVDRVIKEKEVAKRTKWDWEKRDGVEIEIKGQKVILKMKNNGKNNLKLEIDITNINIQNLLDAIIAEQKKSEQEKGKNSQGEEILFSMLTELNGKITDREKLHLLELIFGWINKNKVLDTALHAYLEESEKSEHKDSISQIIKVLDLEIGDITLQTDSEI